MRAARLGQGEYQALRASRQVIVRRCRLLSGLVAPSSLFVCRSFSVGTKGAAVPSHLEGTMWFIAMLFYGSRLRLEECLQLRVNDVDLDRHQVIVRRGKGQKDRTTMLAIAVVEPLQRHLAVVRQRHAADLQAGGGRVVLRDALARKYSNAARE
jgi:hypothetical protein